VGVELHLGERYAPLSISFSAATFLSMSVSMAAAPCFALCGAPMIALVCHFAEVLEDGTDNREGSGFIQHPSVQSPRDSVISGTVASPWLQIIFFFILLS